MASSIATKLTCFVLLCMVTCAPLAHAAITCNQVSAALVQCVPYLTGQGPASPGCCSGVRSLNSAASTTPDRQQACNCMESAAAGMWSIDYNLANGIAGQCGVNIPYQISPSTDCTSVE